MKIVVKCHDIAVIILKTYGQGGFIILHLQILHQSARLLIGDDRLNKLGLVDSYQRGGIQQGSTNYTNAYSNTWLSPSKAVPMGTQEQEAKRKAGRGSASMQN